MRIMVVDDEPDVLDLITAYLSDSGHEIEATTNSVEAMERLKLGGYDALVTDVLIPDFDGIELIRAVRRSNPNIWIVAISGGGEHLRATTALSLIRVFGADKILYKPFEQDELIAALRRPTATAETAA